MSLVERGWSGLRRFTPARVGLGRTGVSLPTGRTLELEEALALARDAVHAELDTGALCAALGAAGLEAMVCASAAPERATYLRRPDLGRRLSSGSRAALEALPREVPDLALVLADGLSAEAVRRHAVPLVSALRATLPAARWRLAPVVVVTQGRVAVGDEVGAALGARAVAVLIGERPGSSAADSLGVYVTWEPRPGRVDAERNCLSNVRDGGLEVGEAARSLAGLLEAARAHGRTGVALGQALAAGGVTGALGPPVDVPGP